MRSTLYKQNKWKEVCVLYLKDKRKKKEKEKKSLTKLNHLSSTVMFANIEKLLMCRFKCYRERWCLTTEGACTRHPKGKGSFHLLARAVHVPTTFSFQIYLYISKHSITLNSNQHFFKKNQRTRTQIKKKQNYKSI